MPLPLRPGLIARDICIHQHLLLRRLSCSSRAAIDTRRALTRWGSCPQAGGKPRPSARVDFAKGLPAYKLQPTSETSPPSGVTAPGVTILVRLLDARHKYACPVLRDPGYRVAPVVV